MQDITYQSPAHEIENILAGIYPLPLIIPQQMIKNVYNKYLDSINSDILCRFVKMNKIEAIGND